MNVFANGGETSYNIVKIMIDIMNREKVSDKWVLFTYYNTIPPKSTTKKINTIYMAYDSETKTTDKTIWDELAYFSSNEPDLIICVDKTSYNFYKKHKLPTEYIPMGYDDINYKEVNTERKHGVGFFGTIDKERNSIFHERYLYYKDMINMSNIYFPNINNVIPYNKINEEYSKCIIGFNDIILGINQRCFEIPIAGTCMLVNDTIRKPINNDYPLKENKHYKVYESFSDFLLKAKDMLDDKEETLKMGERAKKEALKHPFSKGVIKVIDKWKMR